MCGRHADQDITQSSRQGSTTVKTPCQFAAGPFGLPYAGAMIDMTCIIGQYTCVPVDQQLRRVEMPPFDSYETARHHHFLCSRVVQVNQTYFESPARGSTSLTAGKRAVPQRGPSGNCPQRGRDDWSVFGTS